MKTSYNRNHYRFQRTQSRDMAAAEWIDTRPGLWSRFVAWLMGAF